MIHHKLDNTNTALGDLRRSESGICSTLNKCAFINNKTNQIKKN